MNPLDRVAWRLTASPEPFAAPLSRWLVLRGSDAEVNVSRTVHETPLTETIVVDGLHFTDGRGERLLIHRVRPDRIELRSAAGEADVMLVGEEGLALLCGTGVAPRWRSLDPHVVPTSVTDSDGCVLVLGVVDPGTQADLRAGGTGAARAAVRGRAQEWWRTWFDGASTAIQGDPAAYLHAWWALAVNQVRLRNDRDRVAVVPSKVGYLGVWQWDAYFIAIGLRHGQLALAWDQFDLAIRHQGPDGQLPDVIHDEGILDRVASLPPADMARLAEHVGTRDVLAGGTGSALVADVPVTKPPLGAWALAKLLDSCEGLGQNGSPPAAAVREAVRRLGLAQDWWFTHSDPTGRGLPRYLHPYSSGIDDCPAWDYGTDIDTPDLGAYLALNGDALASLSERLGNRADAARWKAQADGVSARLLEQLWSPWVQRFVPRRGDTDLSLRTALELMPLLTGRLPERIASRVVDSLSDPAAFAAPHRLPTTGIGDRHFDAEQMWRGPVWINTNYLVVQGLRRQGRHDEADRLVHETLAMVDASSTMAEYWNPLTGQPARRASAPFSWSAALYIDLAVTGGR